MNNIFKPKWITALPTGVTVALVMAGFFGVGIVLRTIVSITSTIGNTISLVFSLVFLSASISYGAGFDCQKASSSIEKLICSNQQLSRLDDQMNRAYRMKIWNAGIYGLKEAPVEQQRWIKSVRNKCEDVSCLTNAYAARLEELESIKTSQAEGKYVANSAEFLYQEKAFLNSLSGNGISASACPVIVRLIEAYPVGRDDSYGAFCRLSNGKLLMICDDTMIGKLTAKFGAFALSGKELVNFTKSNCPSGG